MDVTNNKNIPFEGFSLERSSSFSPEHDELQASAAKFQEHKLEDISHKSEPTPQKYTEQFYDDTKLAYMKQKGNQPLERKPFIFEKGGKVNVVSDHIEEIKRALQKKP